MSPLSCNNVPDQSESTIDIYGISSAWRRCRREALICNPQIFFSEFYLGAPVSGGGFPRVVGVKISVETVVNTL